MTITSDPQHRPLRRALISCYDKQGLAPFVAELVEHGVQVLSTGSTAKVLAEAGLPVTGVAEVTGFPECLGGRVKTLHPVIHAGILADRDDPGHVEQLEQLGIAAIDLVVVNLYPFAATVESGADEAEVIEMIDIGGPTMIRAAAKNHGSVGVVVDPGDYTRVLADLQAYGGLANDTRLELARTAFAHTARYDAAVSAWFARDELLPEQLDLVLPREATLRYGENPHQRAALYRRSTAGSSAGVAGARQRHGKPLSYNNLLDADAAWGLVLDVDDPAVAIIKHKNPSGFALDERLERAYERALEGDPVSAFGGIVAANRPIDAPTARRILEVFTEVVIAPGYDDEAYGLLASKTNLRVLEQPELVAGDPGPTLRSIAGGVLVQEGDTEPEPWDDWRVVTRTAPSDAVMADLRMAWIAAKHTTSNAIVLVKDRQLIGAGAGQMSRVDSVRLAVERSQGRQHGSVLASDAFFPFRDGPDAAVAAGVVAIVQPGGSVRDEEVIAAADEHGIAMVLTGRRHFRH